MLVKNNCNANNVNYGDDADDVHLPKRIDCESLVNEYGKVKMLHTFQVKHLSKKKKMIKYIMTIHDDSSAVIFWQQEVDFDIKVDEKYHFYLEGKMLYTWSIYDFFPLEQNQPVPVRLRT